MKDKSDVGWCLGTGWGDVCCGDDQRFARNFILKQIDVVYSVEKSQSKGRYSCSAIVNSEFLSALSWLVVDFFFWLVNESPTEIYKTKNFVKLLLFTPQQLQKITLRSALRLLRILLILFLSKKTWGAWLAKDSHRAGWDFSKYSLKLSVL